MQSMQVYDQAQGLGEPDTAARLTALAEVCLREGKVTEARELLERALSVHQRSLGPSAPETLRDLVKLATVLEESGDIEGAISRYERAAAAFDRMVAGKQEGETAVLMNLGRLYASQAQFSKALATFQRALRLVERSKDERAAQIYEALALVNRTLGRTHAAEGFYGLALLVWQELPGDRSREIRANVEKHASMLREQGREEEARRIAGQGEAFVESSRP